MAMKADVADGGGNIADGVGGIAPPDSPDGAGHFALASNLADGVCQISQSTLTARFPLFQRFNLHKLGIMGVGHNIAVTHRFFAFMRQRVNLFLR